MFQKPNKSADPSAAPADTADAGPAGFAPLPQAERPPLGALIANETRLRHPNPNS